MHHPATGHAAWVVAVREIYFAAAANAHAVEVAVNIDAKRVYIVPVDCSDEITVLAVELLEREHHSRVIEVGVIVDTIDDTPDLALKSHVLGIGPGPSILGRLRQGS